MPVATCQICQKQFKSQGHLDQHMATHKAAGGTATGGGSTGVTPPVAPVPAKKPTWPSFSTPAAPVAPNTVPQGGGVLVTSGIWEMGVALENEFLERHKAKCSPEQSKAMDTNLAAYMGQSGKPISPSMGLIFGFISIYLTPIVMEFAPALKAWGREQWDKYEEQKKKKAEAGKRGADRSQLPAAGQ